MLRLRTVMKLQPSTAWRIWSRGVRTFARTINPAEPRSCERPQRVQKLVSADVTRCCPHFERVPGSYSGVKVVRVRICKRKDLERSCQQKVRDRWMLERF